MESPLYYQFTKNAKSKIIDQIPIFNEMNSLKSPEKLVVFLIIGFLSLTIAKSISLTTKYGGGDLRTRIVGSRLLETGHSPYFYHWKPADGEFFLDPGDQAGRMVNGNVVTPATLFLIYPLAQLNYYSIILIWNLLQIAATFSIIWLLFKDRINSTYLTPLAIILIGLICSETWLFNIERSQMHIFYALVFAIIYRSYISDWKYNEFLSGFFAGIFILFRPFAGIIGLGFLLYWKKKWLAGCIAGFLAGSALFVIPQPKLWGDYFEAMQEYVNENTGNGHFNQSVPDPIKPIIIEGSDRINHHYVFNLDRLDTSYHIFKRAGFTINSNGSLLIYALFVVILSIIFLNKKGKSQEATTLFLFGFLLYMLAEQFVLAPRAAYNVIQWIFPLSIIAANARNQYSLLIVIATGLLFLHKFPFIMPFQGHIAELIFFGVVTYYTFYQAGSDLTEDRGRLAQINS